MYLHHETLTPTQRASAEHRKRLNANIAARAEELKTAKPIPIDEIIPTVPTGCDNEPERIFKRIKALNIEIEALSERYAKIMGRWYPRIEQIQAAVCQHYKVSVKDLISSQRTASIVRPRQVAMYLCRELTLRSLPEIGRKFGSRDHTTVLHGARKIHSLRAVDEALDSALIAIGATVSGPVSLRPASQPQEATDADPLPTD